MLDMDKSGTSLNELLTSAHAYSKPVQLVGLDRAPVSNFRLTDLVDLINNKDGNFITNQTEMFGSKNPYARIEYHGIIFSTVTNHSEFISDEFLKDSLAMAIFINQHTDERFFDVSVYVSKRGPVSRENLNTVMFKDTDKSHTDIDSANIYRLLLDVNTSLSTDEEISLDDTWNMFVKMMAKRISIVRIRELRKHRDMLMDQLIAVSNNIEKLEQYLEIQ